MASTSQKRANRNYGEKCITKTVKYTPNEIKEYEKLENYLEESGNTFSGLVKELLKKHIQKSEEQPIIKTASTISSAKNITALSFETYPFFNIELGKMEYLYEHFNKEVIDQIMKNTLESFDESLHDCGYFEDYGCRFEEWVEDTVKDMIENNEFKDLTQKEIINKLESSMCDNQLYDIYP